MFYDNFMALCKQKGVTPSAVMRTIGLNKSSASYWKKGTTPSSDTLQKLADYFGVSVDYLLGKSDTPTRQITFNATPNPEWTELERKMEDGTITPDEARRFRELMNQSRENSLKAISRMTQQLLDLLDKVPASKLQAIVDATEHAIAECAETAPQPSSPPLEGSSTTPPPDAPETPPEGD